MSTDRRASYKPFDRSLIRRFLGAKEVVSVELLLAGKGNTNYKLVLSDGGAYVLRLYRAENSRREAYAMDLVRDLVPVPVEVDRGDTWSLFTFLEGEHLEDVPEHTGAAAEALARISSVVFESPGLIEADGSISPFPWGGVKGFINESLATAEVEAWIGRNRVEAVLELVDRQSPRLAELDAGSRLVHGDFNTTNVLIRGGLVAGILDWEYCHSGTPYMDIGNLLRHTHPDYHSRIGSGLEAGGMSLPNDWMERAELVDLTSHLEFLTSSRSDDFKRRCVARIDSLLRRARNFTRYEPHF